MLSLAALLPNSPFSVTPYWPTLVIPMLSYVRPQTMPVLGKQCCTPRSVQDVGVLRLDLLGVVALPELGHDHLLLDNMEVDAPFEVGLVNPLLELGIVNPFLFRELPAADDSRSSALP